MKNGSKHHSLIAKAFANLIGMQNILHDHATTAILPTAMSNKFDELVTTFLQSYTMLANMAYKDGKLLFSMAPKFHYLWHLGKRANFLNPRKGNTFIDEEIITAHFPERDLQSYREDKSMMAQMVPLMPDFYVGDPGDLDRFVSIARKLGGAAGSFMGGGKSSEKK